MHRPTLDLASRRTRIAAVLAVVAALAVAALLVDPDARQSTSGDTTGRAPATGTGGMSAPGDDAVGATQPAPVDATAALAEFLPKEQAGSGGADRAGAPPVADGELSIAPADGDGGLGAPELDARLVRTGAIELRVPRKRFEQAWGDVQAAGTGSGGYVIGASRSGAGDSARRATITLRVPSARFETAIERLRDVRGAKVGRLDVASQDVTQEFVDTRSRLRHDRAVEGRLVALLADADGVSEVLAVQARLDSVQQQIEVARGRLQYLEKVTSMGTIEVSIVTPSAAGRRDRSEPSELGEAFRDAGSRFVENVAGAVVWLGGALPALIVLAIAAAVGRIAWNRRVARPDRTHADPS